MIVNLKNYKVAKKYAEDAVNILKVVDLAMRGLQLYRHYKPVAAMLSDLKDNKVMLEAHLQTANKILAQGKSQGGSDE